MEVKYFFDDQRTFTLTYIAYDPHTKDAVVIDPVLDLDTTPWRTFTDSADSVAEFIESSGLTVHWILDTHVHADHISGSAELKKRFDAPLAIGKDICAVQEIFKKTFNLQSNFPIDGSQFDRLLGDGEVIQAGSLEIEVMHTPGHTPACNTYKIEDTIFTGDVLFIPDIGVARCDFPKGSARDLFHSITKRLYALPDETPVYVGHDYPKGRELRYVTTIGESKQSNVDLPADVDEEIFVSKITNRDDHLPAPRLLFPSLQVNISAGQLPIAEDNNVSYLRIPLNYL